LIEWGDWLITSCHKKLTEGIFLTFFFVFCFVLFFFFEIAYPRKPNWSKHSTSEVRRRRRNNSWKGWNCFEESSSIHFSNPSKWWTLAFWIFWPFIFNASLGKSKLIFNDGSVVTKALLTKNRKGLQIMVVYLSGSLNTVLSSDHKKEIIRYIYNHQVSIYIYTPFLQKG